MDFINIKNGQIAHIEDKNLINEFTNNKDWQITNEQSINETKNELQNYKTVKRVEFIKNKLLKFSEDIIQSQVGEIVPNIDAKKDEFILLHNELRELEGKPKRQIYLINK